MLFRHTGTQLLRPACGVALGCLWPPILEVSEMLIFLKGRSFCLRSHI